MFTQLYIYAVPLNEVVGFCEIQRKAAEIYELHGCLEEKTWRLLDGPNPHPFKGLGGLLQAGPSEALFVSTSRYRDADHLSEVMARVDADPRISRLYRDFSAIVPPSRVYSAILEGV
jgi:hypothetical protein